MTINKVCGSGLKAVMLAAQAVRCGDADIVIAGGQENMSASPHVLLGSRDGFRMGDAKLTDTMIVDGLWDVYNQYHMGTTAENVAKQYGISRAQQDEFAVAQPEQGRGRAEGRQVQGRDRPGDDPAAQGRSGGVRQRRIHQERHDARAVSRACKPAFAKDGSVTAANASGLNDGAAAVLVMTAERAKQLGLTPLARIKAYASSGVDPAIMGMGPVPASKRCLEKAGWKAADLDLMEINEAFAAQACAVNKEMGWDTSEDQRQRRRHRARTSDRRVRLPRAGDAAARDAPPQREEGTGVAVHRRRHGRGAGGRALDTDIDKTQDDQQH